MGMLCAIASRANHSAFLRSSMPFFCLWRHRYWMNWPQSDEYHRDISMHSNGAASL